MQATTSCACCSQHQSFSWRVGCFTLAQSAGPEMISGGSFHLIMVVTITCCLIAAVCSSCCTCGWDLLCSPSLRLACWRYALYCRMRAIGAAEGTRLARAFSPLGECGALHQVWALHEISATVASSALRSLLLPCCSVRSYCNSRLY